MGLHNISCEFNLFAQEHCHLDNATSVHTWVEAMKTQDEPDVQLYKQQEKQWEGNSPPKNVGSSLDDRNTAGDAEKIWVCHCVLIPRIERS